MVDGTTTEIDDDDVGGLTDTEIKSVFQMTTNFVEENDCSPGNGKGNDFDAILWEMTMAVKECDANDKEGMKNMIEGWVSMEDNDFCQNVLAEERDELMDIDMLCNLKEVNDVEEVDAMDDDSDNVSPEKASPKTAVVSHDDVNDLATQLKAFSVQVGALGDEYRDAAIAANDASEKVRAAFRKNENKKTKKKQAKARQPLMHAFLKPQKK